MLKICNVCKNENPENAEYCKFCGNRLTNNNANNYSNNFSNGNSYGNSYGNANDNFNNGNGFGAGYVNGNGNFNNGNFNNGNGFGNSYDNGNANFGNGSGYVSGNFNNGNSYGNANDNFSYVNNNGNNNFVKEVPPECKEINVSAFFLGFIWALANHITIGLLCLVPFFGIIMNFILLFKGNEWAWKNSNFSSVEEFRKKQRTLSIITCVLYAVIFIGLGIFCIFNCYNNYYYDGGYDPRPYPMPGPGPLPEPGPGPLPYF